MPTARELLEQADALMRRNRKRGRGPLDVPTLTDALGVDRDALLAATVVLPETNVAADPIDLERPNENWTTPTSAPAPDADPISLDTLSDVPVLTDAVLAWPPRDEGASTQEEPPVDAGDVDAFPASAAEAHVLAAALPPPEVLEQAPAEVSAPARELAPGDQGSSPLRSTAPALEDDFILELPPPAEQGAIADTAEASAPPSSPIPSVPAPVATAPVSRDWDALAEEIRMQVLQRLDLFTDTGLRDQLGAHLSPIVERASAQLVATINRELGELVRGYVAEAIEREIDTWRNREPQ